MANGSLSQLVRKLFQDPEGKPLWRRGFGIQQLENSSNPIESYTMATVCKHPRVRIVSRQEDAEYVECLECGDVFDSEEFRDMEIEETVETEEAEADS